MWRHWQMFGVLTGPFKEGATGETLQPHNREHLNLSSQSPYLYANTSTIIPVSHVLADTKMMRDIYIFKLSQVWLQNDAVTASATQHTVVSSRLFLSNETSSILDETGNRSQLCRTQTKENNSSYKYLLEFFLHTNVQKMRRGGVFCSRMIV